MKKVFVVIMLALSCMLLTSCGGPESTYKSAQTLLSQGKYTEAAEKFESLGSYEDATTLTMYCKACALCESGDYETGIAALETLGSFKDCTMRITYYNARAYEDYAGTEHWEYMQEAKAIYKTIPVFLDSAERMGALDERIEAANSAQYNAAVAAADGGDYYTAVNGFKRLGNYNDSKKRDTYYCIRADEAGLTESADQDALIAISSRYSEMGDYLDCTVRAAAMAAKADEIVSNKYGEVMLLIDAGDLAGAKTLLDAFGDYGNEEVPKHYVSITEQCIAENQWDEALASFEKINQYAEMQQDSRVVHIAQQLQLRFAKSISQPFFLGEGILTHLVFKTDDEMFGIMGINGEMVLQPKYSEINVHSEVPYIFVLKTGTSYRNEKYGMYNAATGLIIEPTWSAAEVIYNSEMIAYQESGKWGIIDANGKVIIEPHWDEIGGISGHENNRISVKQNGYWGFVDLDGQVIVEPAWDKVSGFEDNGYAEVERDDKSGLIDLNGSIVLPVEYKYFFTTTIGQETWFYLSGRYAHYDFDTQTIGTRYEDYIHCNDGTGNILVELRDDVWAIANERGELIGDSIELNGVQRFSEGLCPAHVVTKYTDLDCGYIDTMGSVVIPPKWDVAEPFFWGVAAVRTDYSDGEQWGLIDKQGNIVVEPQWDDMHAWSVDYRAYGESNLYAVCENNKWGIIDTAGNVIVEPQWNKRPLIYGEDDFGEISVGNKEGVVDFYGNTVIQPVWDDVVINDEAKLFAVKSAQKWGVYDKENNNLIPIEYDYISILSDERILVKRGKKWFILDEKGNQIW